MGECDVSKSGETRVQGGEGGPTMSSVTKVQVGGVVKGVGWIQVFITNFLNLLIYLAVLGLGCGMWDLVLATGPPGRSQHTDLWSELLLFM